MHNGASWTYGPCSFDASEKQGSDNTTIYVEKCCLFEREYTLKCRDSEKRGWSGEYLQIQGHKHCQDFFVGYTARRKIAVLGMNWSFRF